MMNQDEIREQQLQQQLRQQQLQLRLLQQQTSENDFSLGLEDLQNSMASLSNANTISVNYDEIPVPCCRLDVTASIIRCNQMLVDLIGCSKDKLLQITFLELVDSSSYDIIGKIIPAANRESVISTIDSENIWLKRMDCSHIFPASVSIKSIQDKTGRTIGYTVVLIDQTVNQRKIEQAEKVRDELRRKEKLKDDFITVASHELKTPIQPILGYVSLAKKGLISDEKALDGILKSTHVLQKLAGDILDVSRIDSGNLQYDMTKVKINSLLESVSNSVHNELSSKVSLVIRHNGSDKDLEIEVDQSRMGQAIRNLLLNSIKFTETGSIVIETNSKLVENRVEIRVIDTGKGISEEVLPALFEKFVTKGHGEVENGKGTGLGLYICKSIVNAHNGEISASNNAGGGATFMIRIPISQSEQTITDAESMNIKGMSLVQKNQLRVALECFDFALKLNPNHSKAWYNKGMSLVRLGESKEDALLCFQKAIEINPLDAEAWNNKGSVLVMLGNHGDALTCYDRALELRSGYGKAWQNKGVLLVKMGDKKGAKECLRNAVDSSLSHSE